MSNPSPWFSNRKLERLCLLLIGIIMGFLFWKLFSVLQRDFSEVNTRMENGTMINLNAGKPAETMTSLLKKGLYFEDPRDIAFIAAALSAIKDTGSAIDNTGALNKKKYFVIALKYEDESEYRYLIARDMTWRDTDIIKTFSFRWLVEVFIQDWKQYEGWNQLSKQPGEEGSIRGVTLSLLSDHALLLHEDQKVLLENKQPAATVGSLREKVMMESLKSFIEEIVSSDNPKILFEEYADKITATAREKQIKSWKSTKKIKQLITG